MEIPYRHINCKPFILLLVLGVCLIATAQRVYAYDDLFRVDGVTVDITAENAVAARDQAFAKAQSDAFAILAQRMVAEAQVQNVQTPDATTISTLIQDFEVTNEQLSNVRYVGTYTFRFDQAAVSQFFSVSGVQFTNQSQPAMLVLPFFQEGGKINLWSESNLWLSSWAGATLQRGVVPIVVPIGDLMDVGDLDDARALSYDPEGLTRMLRRYEAGDAALMIAVPDAELASVAGGGDIAKGNLRISLYSTDGNGPTIVQEMNFTADGTQTRDALYAKAVSDLHALLQKDWKSGAFDTSVAEQAFIVSAEFANLGEWVKIQSALKGVRGVSNISIGSLKQNSARIAFAFRGDENALRQSLAQHNLDLGTSDVNSEANPFTENGREQQPVIYRLTYRVFDAVQPIETQEQSSPELDHVYGAPEIQPETQETAPQQGNSFYRPPAADQNAAGGESAVEDLPAPPVVTTPEEVQDITPTPRKPAIDMNSGAQAEEFGVKTF